MDIKDFVRYFLQITIGKQKRDYKLNVVRASQKVSSVNLVSIKCQGDNQQTSIFIQQDYPFGSASLALDSYQRQHIKEEFAFVKAFLVQMDSNITFKP